jgi:hypothetical protein
MLDKAKQDTFPVKPYEMHIVSGEIGNCPHIRDVKLVKGDPGLPVEFTCEVHYSGKPELKFKLKGEPGSFASHLLPDVLVELHTISFTAKIHVESSMKNNYAKFYFIEKPDLVWDLEVEVSHLNIPIHIEDMLDNRVEQEFAKINEEHPHEVKFAAEVKVRQKEWSGKKKKKKFFSGKEAEGEADEDGYLDEQTFKIGENAEEEEKRTKKKRKPKLHGTNMKKQSHSHMPHLPSTHMFTHRTKSEGGEGDKSETKSETSEKKKKSSRSLLGGSFVTSKSNSGILSPSSETTGGDESEPLVRSPKKKSSFSFMNMSTSSRPKTKSSEDLTQVAEEHPQDAQNIV